MKTDMKLTVALIALLCGGILASAQETATIATYLTASGKARIVQPAALNARLATHMADDESAPAEAAAATGGYRIQVYSGNNAATAKRDAESRAAAIRGRFPEIATYVTYDAPYWRLRAGDFTVYENAAAVLGEMKRAFPAFAREMRLVRDRIKQ